MTGFRLVFIIFSFIIIIIILFLIYYWKLSDFIGKRELTFILVLNKYSLLWWCLFSKWLFNHRRMMLIVKNVPYINLYFLLVSQVIFQFSLAIIRLFFRFRNICQKVYYHLFSFFKLASLQIWTVLAIDKFWFCLNHFVLSIAVPIYKFIQWLFANFGNYQNYKNSANNTNKWDQTYSDYLSKFIIITWYKVWD